jgi:hypothetical protein
MKTTGTLFVALVAFTSTVFAPSAHAAPVYSPTIVPSEFTTIIDNPYFALPVGREFEYEGDTADGLETGEVSISGETKVVMGVTTLVYHDRVWLDGELIEDTRDYLAQHNDGTVWYFGEDVDNYEGGVLQDHDGAWLAGVDGAQPGIWMLANPKVGDVYREEYYAGEAEDMAEVLSLTEQVSTEYGTFDNCLKTYNYTALEPDVKEYKYYCKDVGGLVLETDPAQSERIELVEVETEIGNDTDDTTSADIDRTARIAELKRTLRTLLDELVALLRGA